MRAVRRRVAGDEQITFFTRMHRGSLVTRILPAATAGAGGAAGILIAAERLEMERDIAVAAAIAIAALFAARLTMDALRWRGRRMVLTDRRVIVTHGMLGRRIASVPLANIAGVELRRSIFGRLFGYGALLLRVPGETLRIRPLPRPKDAHRAVLETLRPPGRARIPEGPSRGEATRSNTVGGAPVAPDPSGVAIAGRYRLERRLATGGMGTVHAAIDERLGRRVAVKVLRDELARDARSRERFRREARAVAALNHPSIAAIYDYGEEGDLSYIVMELVAGRDVAAMLEDEGTLDPHHATEIIAAVLDALGHAHDAGIVHRDVKPGNVIVTPSHVVKVTDFGIARAAGDERLTATGAVLGSAHYLSPEQARGERATPSSDIYSTGVLLFEILTGSPPFDGESPVLVAERRLTESVPAPSRVVAGISESLDEVVRRATSKRPEDRYPSAAHMAHALRTVAERDRRGRKTLRLGNADTPELLT